MLPGTAETPRMGAQAKDAAHTAANAAHRSAKATWSALERMTQAYTNSRQYYMLDDLVEATGAAKKVGALPLPSGTVPAIAVLLAGSPHIDRPSSSKRCFQQEPARPICPWCVDVLKICSRVKSYGQFFRLGATHERVKGAACCTVLREGCHSPR